MLQPPNIDLAQERECVPRTAISGGHDLQQTPPQLDSRCRFQGVGVAIRRSSSLDETDILESLVPARNTATGETYRRWGGSKW